METSAVKDKAAIRPACSADKAIVVVEQWFMDCVHNSPAARDTTVYNGLLQAKDELNKRLQEALTNEAV